MPINDIEGLDKMVNALGRIELKRLIRRGSVSENLALEKKMWNISVEKKVLNLLQQSPMLVSNHFNNNIDTYKNEWIESVKDNFNISDRQEKLPSPNWRKTIENEKKQNDKEHLK